MHAVHASNVYAPTRRLVGLCQDCEHMIVHDLRIGAASVGGGSLLPGMLLLTEAEGLCAPPRRVRTSLWAT